MIVPDMHAVDWIPLIYITGVFPSAFLLWHLVLDTAKEMWPIKLLVCFCFGWIMLPLGIGILTWLKTDQVEYMRREAEKARFKFEIEKIERAKMKVWDE